MSVWLGQRAFVMAAQARGFLEHLEALEAFVQDVRARLEENPIGGPFVKHCVDNAAQRCDIFAEQLQLTVRHIGAIARSRSVKLRRRSTRGLAASGGALEDESKGLENREQRGAAEEHRPNWRPGHACAIGKLCSRLKHWRKCGSYATVTTQRRQVLLQIQRGDSGVRPASAAALCVSPLSAARPTCDAARQSAPPTVLARIFSSCPSPGRTCIGCRARLLHSHDCLVAQRVAEQDAPDRDDREHAAAGVADDLCELHRSDPGFTVDRLSPRRVPRSEES